VTDFGKVAVTPTPGKQLFHGAYIFKLFAELYHKEAKVRHSKFSN
jgi:hypothetical protein